MGYNEALSLTSLSLRNDDDHLPTGNFLHLIKFFTLTQRPFLSYSYFLSLLYSQLEACSFLAPLSQAHTDPKSTLRPTL